jgi:hypothetical protein
LGTPTASIGLVTRLPTLACIPLIIGIEHPENNRMRLDRAIPCLCHKKHDKLTILSKPSIILLR